MANPYYKYDSLEVLKDIFDSSKYLELNKTYRSTSKIIEYTNNILGLEHVSAIRNNNAKDVIIRNSEKYNDILNDLNNEVIRNLEMGNMQLVKAHYKLENLEDIDKLLDIYKKNSADL